MELLAIFGTAYCLHYTFMGRLAEVMSGFAFPFLISLIMLTLLIVWFRIKDSEWLFLRVQDSIVFYLAIFLYPLSVVDEDHTALWMQFFCLGILIHVCILAIKRAVRSAAKEEFVHR